MATPLSLQQEVDAQVKAGMCTRGETATGCLLADGTEAACQTIRECAPSQHFEYALPGSSPNVNIWVAGENGLEWSGRVDQTPIYQPGIGVDPFSGLPSPVINYDLIPYIPAPTYGPGQGQVNYTGPRGTVTGGNAVGGTPIAPAYGLGLQQDLDTYLRGTLGRTSVTQVEFCAAYQRLSGFECDFNNSEGGAKEAAAWLTQLQSEQNARVSVIGNRPLPGYGSPGGGGSTPPPTASGSGSVADPSIFGGMSPAVLIIIAIVIIAIMRKG